MTVKKLLALTSLVAAGSMLAGLSANAQQPPQPQQTAGNDDEWTYERTSGNSSGDVNYEHYVGRMSARSTPWPVTSCIGIRAEFALSRQDGNQN